MTQQVDNMKIHTTLLCGMLALVSLASCSSETEFELISNQKICVSNERVVAADMLNSSTTKEVTITQDLNDWSSNLSGDVYVHITASDKAVTSKFSSELESHVALLDKDQLPTVSNLVKVEDEESVGVFHLFDSSSVLSMKGYVGSCFTLSDTMGECTIATNSGKYHLKADIPLGALNEWKLIRRRLTGLPSKLSCK
jgi:hypothetical protein